MLRNEHEGRELSYSGTIMAKLIIEPKKAKDGQIDYIVNYHDPKSDNSFTITTTNNLDEAVQRLRSTLESEVQAMVQKK